VRASQKTDIKDFLDTQTSLSNNAVGTTSHDHPAAAFDPDSTTGSFDQFMFHGSP
jgi:hypothetical protein